MSYKITDFFIPVGHPNRCGRKLTEAKSLVYHYTANYSKTANAMGNAKYFARQYKVVDKSFTELSGKAFVYGSAHYIIDDSSVVRSIPENEVGFHVGAKSYTAWTVKTFNSKPNDYTLGIELCVNEGNDWNKTLDTAIELGADIMIRNNIPIDMVCRHFDVTGKACPVPFINENEPAWNDFKKRLADKVKEKKGVKKVEWIFNDIEGHYACGSIEYLAKAGLLSGIGDGSYRPDEVVTRGQLAVVLERLLKNGFIKQ